jgi:hypothetical protein
LIISCTPEEATLLAKSVFASRNPFSPALSIVQTGIAFYTYPYFFKALPNGEKSSRSRTWPQPAVFHRIVEKL